MIIVMQQGAAKKDLTEVLKKIRQLDEEMPDILAEILQHRRDLPGLGGVLTCGSCQAISPPTAQPTRTATLAVGCG